MKKLILVFSIICFNLVAYAQESLVSKEVQNHIKERIDKGLNVGIVVGVIDGDKVEFFSYGKTALENGENVDEGSVFEIGSITKTFTTIMIADEVLKGNMKLSDPISMHLPAHVKVPTRNGKVITVKDVATHSSAIPRMPDNFAPTNPNNPYADYTIELAYEYMSSIELTRDIGERYEYSNFAMGMLGHILELQTGKTYEEVMVDRIANPLGMDNTRVVFTEYMKKHLAYGHANGSQVENWDLPAMAGAGAIRSTATDMVKYLQANMGLTKTKLNEAMKMTHQTAYTNEAQNFSIGLGWHFANDDKVVWHNGGTGGYISFAGFLRDSEKGVVVLTNTQENINDIGFKILNPDFELKLPKISIETVLKEAIDANGIKEGIAFYHKLKQTDTETYSFDEGALNRLGYKYMGEDELGIALELFKLNVEMFPKASNPYDSLGEAQLKKGDTISSIKNYTKSLELNPANENAKDVLKSLNVKTEDIIKDVVLSEDTLDTYLGEYQLMPEFTITITREGTQVFGQGSGQPPFEMFPSSETEFYLKAVQARVVFNKDDSGNVTSMTLFQGGQELNGKKVK